MGFILNVLAVFLTLIVIYYILSWLFGGNSVTIKTNVDGKTSNVIPASTIPSSSVSGNYTYSVWFYVNDWNYRFGEQKILLSRLNGDKNPSPVISFDTMENNILIALSTYNSSAPPAAPPGTPTPNTKSQTNTYTVRNFQLQKWVNLIVSVYGRTLDVYLDGKLVRTFVLPGTANVSASSNLTITPNGGFDGQTSNFQYWPNASNPQQAYNIYKAGFGGSILGNLFNKYRLKISFLDNNIESSSFEI
jgi:hypothetical protein